MLFFDNTVEKAKKGDKKALERLYRDNFKSLYLFVRYKVNTNEQAEDICAEALLKSFENIQKFSGNSSFKSWLYTIAKNLVFDFYKKNSHVAETGDEFIEEHPEEESVKSDNSVILKQLKIIMDSLSEKYRRVLELRFIANLSIAETAEVMKITTGNVKVLQNRAIQKAKASIPKL